MITSKICLNCKKEYLLSYKYSRKQRLASKYCSILCKNESTEFKEKERQSHKGILAYNYKGDKANYRSLHAWVVRWLGQPQTCSKCDKTNLSGHLIHWANKSGQYLRELSDWVRLCVKCHKNFDKKYVE